MKYVYCLLTIIGMSSAHAMPEGLRIKPSEMTVNISNTKSGFFSGLIDLGSSSTLEITTTNKSSSPKSIKIPMPIDEAQVVTDVLKLKLTSAKSLGLPIEVDEFYQSRLEKCSETNAHEYCGNDSYTLNLLAVPALKDYSASLFAKNIYFTEDQKIFLEPNEEGLNFYKNDELVLHLPMEETHAKKMAKHNNQFISQFDFDKNILTLLISPKTINNPTSFLTIFEITKKDELFDNIK